MEILIALLAGSIAAITATVLTYADHLIKEKKRERFDEEIERIDRSLYDTGSSASFARSQWIRDIEGQIAARVASSKGSEHLDIHQEIEKQMIEIHDKISLLEAHFPANANFERTFAVNDSLLSEKIDQLALRLDSIEGRIISKLEIAIIVAKVIAGVALLGGSLYALIVYILI